jgi:hypothetical protein
MRLVIAIASSLILLAGTVSATTITVPDDEAVIATAIASSSAGDTVVVRCGVYYEHDIALKSGVVLTSETGGAYCVTIEAGGAGRVLVGQDVDSNAAVIGFTLKGGQSPSGQPGGGILLDNSSPSFDNCIVKGNSTNDNGGGIAMTGGSASTFTYCDFQGNISGGDGGGIYLDASTPNLVDCGVFDNQAGSAGGGIHATGSSFIANHCQIYENTSGSSGAGIQLTTTSNATFSLVTLYGNYAVLNGGGIACESSSPSFSSCTIAENSCSGSGSGVHVSGTTTATFEKVIIAFNTLDMGVAVSSGTANFIATDISNNSGGDWVGPIAPQATLNQNFSSDPEFCGSGSSGNYFLQMDSPCAPGHGGSAVGQLVGSHIVDCGYIATKNTSWSSVKSMY